MKLRLESEGACGRHPAIVARPDLSFIPTHARIRIDGRSGDRVHAIRARRWPLCNTARWTCLTGSTGLFRADSTVPVADLIYGSRVGKVRWSRRPEDSPFKRARLCRKIIALNW